MISFQWLRAALLAVGCLAGASLAHAHGDSKGHTHKHQHNDEAHVHGVGELEVVQDGPRVSISLYSPLHNVLGFERAPRTEVEKNRVKAANAQLKSKALYAFTPAAQCQQTDVRVRSEVLNPHSHGPGADHQDASESEHSDVKVIWEFACAKPDALKDIDVRLFKAFPGFETLQTQALFAKGQVGAKLTSKQSKLVAP
ncbi:MAG TPA: DUF2796 domain-containing protein [Limnobacter sp.]|nr:DUF2796 domain-containing protein [Limnobacter sp.]